VFAFEVYFELKNHELIKGVNPTPSFGNLDFQLQFNFIDLNAEALAKKIDEQGTPMVMVRILADGIRDLGVTGGQKAGKPRRQPRNESIHQRSRDGTRAPRKSQSGSWG
jgi:hypothetical protein